MSSTKWNVVIIISLGVLNVLMMTLGNRYIQGEANIHMPVWPVDSVIVFLVRLLFLIMVFSHWKKTKVEINILLLTLIVGSTSFWIWHLSRITCEGCMLGG